MVLKNSLTDSTVIYCVTPIDNILGQAQGTQICRRIWDEGKGHTISFF